SGDETITAQVSLLETRQLIEATTAELSRVRMLVERKTAPASELIPIQMQLKRLERQGELRRKELLIRGLSTELISDIVGRNELRDEFVIRVPGSDRPALDGQIALPPVEGNHQPEISADDSESAPEEFTVEEINVHPGQSISPGDQLADLAWHDQLAVEGHAFERDIEAISQLSQRGWKCRIEYGLHGQGLLPAEFDVKFVDNHVDTETGTFRFFLEIQNEEVHSTTDTRGRVFKSWRFKPGQRVHISIPIEQMAGQFVFPREAVVQEGLDSFVFRRHSQTAEFDEYEAVPVTVLYRNSSIAVVASGGELKENNRVALNNAYQLYLATKATGSQGHSHPHPH
ncbi:MAG: HlyD family efflux transporter periplasmic adaptor subunit, partial [Planctomycetaceae bacterium]